MKNYKRALVDIMIDVMFVLALMIFCYINQDWPLAQLIASMAFSIVYFKEGGAKHEPAEETHQEPR